MQKNIFLLKKRLCGEDLIKMNKYYLIGDIHGHYQPIKNFYERNKEMLDGNISAGDKNILICLGDFGANYFFDWGDIKFKKKLGKYPFTYFVIRGNHEERASNCMKKNPQNWEFEKYNDGTVLVEKEFPYIKYALDYPSFYNFNGYKTLVIPGAYSVDKYYRLAMDYSWFPEEQLNEAEMNMCENMLDTVNWKVDLVLSHTCPIIFEPTDLFLSQVDQSTVDKTMERWLGSIEYKLDYKTWCWGHFHSFRDYPRTDGHCKIMLSAGQEAVELDQIMNSEEVIKL